jgi:hypothetical protein
MFKINVTDLNAGYILCYVHIFVWLTILMNWLSLIWDFCQRGIVDWTKMTLNQNKIRQTNFNVSK